MAENPTCPTTEELQQFAQGELPVSLAEPIEEHLKSCRRCVESLNRPASKGLRSGDKRADSPGGRLRGSTAIKDVAGRLTGTPPSNDPGADAPLLPHNPKQEDPDTTT